MGFVFLVTLLIPPELSPTSARTMTTELLVLYAYIM